MPLNAYWLATANGELHRFGNEHSVSRLGTTAPVVAIAGTADGAGCLVLTSDGRIRCHGTARYAGDLTTLDARIVPVDVATSPQGQGYWVIDSHGSVYAFGGAEFHGGVPQVTNDASDPIAIVASPRGSGYWIVDRRGGVTCFGSARYHGPLSHYLDASRLKVVGFGAAPKGEGYWMADSIGGVFALGDASFHGSPTELRSIDVVTLLADGDGYLVVDRRGAVLVFGDAVHRGSLAGLGQRLVAAG